MAISIQQKRLSIHIWTKQPIPEGQVSTLAAESSSGLVPAAHGHDSCDRADGAAVDLAGDPRLAMSQSRSNRLAALHRLGRRRAAPGAARGPGADEAQSVYPADRDRRGHRAVRVARAFATVGVVAGGVLRGGDRVPRAQRFENVLGGGGIGRYRSL